MTDTVNSDENKAKRYKGLKPFVKGDPRINRKGAPPRGQSWRETVKRITDMTREEAIAYVGPTSKIGKQLKELSADMPIKDAIIFATIIAYGREPNARMLAALMDREEGKPEQAIDLSNSDGSLKPEKGIDDERFDRAISTLADAVRESISGTSNKQNSDVDTAK